MGYSADTFVADEQPTTAKWNKLWTNDAAFNDGTGIADNAILTRHILDANVTTPEVKLSTFNYNDTNNSNFTTTSASYTDVTGHTTTYTTGATAERIFAWFSFMCQNSAASSAATCASIGGTDRDTDVSWYPSGAGEWGIVSKLYMHDAAASTAVIMKGRAKTSGGTLTINRSSSFNLPSIRGFAISNA